jgi:hypothetical protein
LGHDVGELLVKIRNQPPAVRETAFAVLVGTARRLHYAVQSQESSRYQLAHVFKSSALTSAEQRRAGLVVACSR